LSADGRWLLIGASPTDLFLIPMASGNARTSPKRAGKRSRPTAAILDSQSVKSDPHGGAVGGPGPFLFQPRDAALSLRAVALRERRSKDCRAQASKKKYPGLVEERCDVKREFRWVAAPSSVRICAIYFEDVIAGGEIGNEGGSLLPKFDPFIAAPSQAVFKSNMFARWEGISREVEHQKGRVPWGEAQFSAGAARFAGNGTWHGTRKIVERHTAIAGNGFDVNWRRQRVQSG
jgi:hypothetical protein